MIKLSNDWQDYSIIATGGGQKLERWGDVVLLRPDPQIIWEARFDLAKYEALNARYLRDSSGGGRWEYFKKMPDNWNISYGDLKFNVKPMGFKHTGLFPEQAANWNILRRLIEKRQNESNADSEIKVLNLFAYTGAASVACAKSKAKVCHVDAAKGMVERAGINAKLSGVDGIRFIIDDCKKFVEREIKRGNFYDGLIMDPPSYGRGPSGELWKLEDNLFDFVKLCRGVLKEKPLFVLVNSYTTGLAPSVLGNILNISLEGLGGCAEAYEIGLPTQEKGIVLPCGASGLYTTENHKE